MLKNTIKLNKMKNKKIVTTEGETFWVTDRVVGCSAYCFRDADLLQEEILLVKKDGKWTIPSGYLEEGCECVLRELQEEVGIDISGLHPRLFDASTRTNEYHQHVIFRYYINANDFDISNIRISFCKFK